MFCPDCGNDCGTARFCSACGREMLPENSSLTPEKLLGTYQGLDGYIVLDSCSVTVYKESPSGIKETTLVHGDIVDVIFSKADGLQLGYLAIQDRSHDSSIESESDAAGDDLAILFAEDANGVFTEIFRNLNQISRKYARENRGANKWKPLVIRNHSACPRCGSTRCSTYFSRNGNYHTWVFNCAKCKLQWEW